MINQTWIHATAEQLFFELETTGAVRIDREFMLVHVTGLVQEWRDMFLKGIRQ